MQIKQINYISPNQITHCPRCIRQLKKWAHFVEYQKKNPLDSSVWRKRKIIFILRVILMDSLWSLFRLFSPDLWLLYHLDCQTNAVLLPIQSSYRRRHHVFHSFWEYVLASLQSIVPEAIQKLNRKMQHTTTRHRSKQITNLFTWESFRFLYVSHPFKNMMNPFTDNCTSFVFFQIILLKKVRDAYYE